MCGTAGPTSKMCSGRKPMIQPSTSKEVVAKDDPSEAPDGAGEWKEMLVKGSKVSAPLTSPLKDVPQKRINHENSWRTVTQQQQRLNQQRKDQQQEVSQPDRQQ